MKKVQKVIVLPVLLLLILLLGFAVYFFWFTPVGYRMTVPLHGFSEVADHIYVENTWNGDQDQLLTMVTDARKRVNGFFGEVYSTPTLIICDDSRKIQRLGGDHDTKTVMIPGVKSYTSISSEHLNTDVLAHEMTHAETHNRIFQGGNSPTIPVWFDEGLAVQNDYRAPYTNETWLQITDGGNAVPPVSEYDTAEKFYRGTTEDRRKNYCLAGHVVSEWIDQNGKESLFQLLENVGRDSEFEALFFENSQ